MDGDKESGAGLPNVGEKPVEKQAGNAVMISPVNESDSLVRADTERNAVFSNLVREDGDIVGLVAYSIYKQNEVDWLHALQKALGRGPTEPEFNSYIIGESTPRRLATYRHLASATLTGNGPETAPEGTWQGNPALGLRSGSKGKPGLSWMASSILSYAILAAAILIGVWLVARYGLPSVHS